MLSDWKEYRIEDIALNSPHAMSTGPFGSAISSKFFQEEGVPVIRGGNLSTDVTDRMSDDGLVFVSEKKAEEFKRSVVRLGDLIFTCWGTINQVGLITEDLEYPGYIISNKQMKLTVDPEKADFLFLYYLFSSPLKQAEILINGIGAAVPGFNLGQLKAHIVYLPPVEEQRRIASVLNSFDKKIRHNSQTNQILEQIAQAIFKSWFVDFEPTRAKIAAKQNEQDPERAAMCSIGGKTDSELDQLSADQLQQLKTTAALFPDALVDSELGEIPEGWEVVEMKDLATKISKGTTPRKADVTKAEDPKNIPFLKVRDITDAGEISRVGLDEIPESIHIGALKRSMLETNDLLFSIAGTIGRVAIVEEDLSNSNCNQALAFIRLKEPETYLELCRLNLVGNRVQDEVVSKVVQGVQANFSLTGLSEIKILAPEAYVLNKFNESIRNIGNKQRLLLTENRKLSELRDALLKKTFRRVDC